MKIVILAGGLGTRLSEYTETIPKPMVDIGGRPMLTHIMSIYANFGYSDFIIAAGYKADHIKRYFLDFHLSNSDFTVDLSSGQMIQYGAASLDWKVSIIDTGQKTLTGSRLLKLRDWLPDDEPFMLTYGDGLANVNIEQLLKYHKDMRAEVTITAVHPPARFGELDIEPNGWVSNFSEKPSTKGDRINGGFFVMQKEFLNRIHEGSDTMLEQGPLASVAEDGKLAAFIHDRYWQCMDTKRDLDRIRAQYSETPPWLMF